MIVQVKVRVDLDGLQTCFWRAGAGSYGCCRRARSKNRMRAQEMQRVQKERKAVWSPRRLRRRQGDSWQQARLPADASTTTYAPNAFLATRQYPTAYDALSGSKVIRGCSTKARCQQRWQWRVVNAPYGEAEPTATSGIAALNLPAALRFKLDDGKLPFPLCSLRPCGYSARSKAEPLSFTPPLTIPKLRRLYLPAG